MADADGTTRRAFLGAALAAGASTLLVGDRDAGVGLRWCHRPVHPLAPKRLYIHRGSLPAGVRAELALTLAGPGLAGADPVVRAAGRVLRDSVTTWDVRLPYRHPELVAGRFTYRAVASVGGAVIESAPIHYDIVPFVFGI